MLFGLNEGAEIIVIFDRQVADGEQVTSKILTEQTIRKEFGDFGMTYKRFGKTG